MSKIADVALLTFMDSTAVIGNWGSIETRTDVLVASVLVIQVVECLTRYALLRVMDHALVVV